MSHATRLQFSHRFVCVDSLNKPIGEACNKKAALLVYHKIIQARRQLSHTYILPVFDFVNSAGTCIEDMKLSIAVELNSSGRIEPFRLCALGIRIDIKAHDFLIKPARTV